MPRKEEHLLSNYEKFKLRNTQKELGNIQKLIRKTVSTQTIDFTRVILFITQKIYFFLSCTQNNSFNQKASMFGIEENDSAHPIFENNPKKGPSKTQILMPINGQHRVTDKVF